MNENFSIEASLLCEKVISSTKGRLSIINIFDRTSIPSNGITRDELNVVFRVKRTNPTRQELSVLKVRVMKPDGTQLQARRDGNQTLSPVELTKNYLWTDKNYLNYITTFKNLHLIDTGLYSIDLFIDGGDDPIKSITWEVITKQT
ncbi:hypothetical protein COB87_002790 [Candidatus Wolfebacteria bacterium]|nr:hypothetical protein [Candidatus Wolfebacteria bacterium]